MGIPSGPFYVDDLLTWTANTHTVTTGAATDADSVPTYRIYEDETGTAIATGSMAKLDDTNTLGFYSEQVTLSAANGYEVGKSYSIYISSTVNSVTATKSENFKVIATPTASLDAAGIRAAVGLASANLDTQLDALPTAAENTTAVWAAGTRNLTASAINSATFATGAITTSTFAAGAINAAAIGADAITDAKVASDVTIASVTGSVGSVTGAVGSVTGNVGGNVTGSVGTVNAFAANSITAAATAADYVTEIQAGLATAAALTVVDDFLDTEVAAIKVVTDKLDTAMVLDGAVYQFTVNALELGPTGSGASAASIADAVWDEVLSGHLTAGTTGAALNASGSGASAATIADAVWDEATSGHVTAGSFGKLVADTNTFVDTEVAAVLAAVDTEVAAIKTVTDHLGTALELDGAVYRYTANALELAPSGGGGGATAGAIWDEPTAGHVTAGTFGKLVADTNTKTANLPSDPADASDIAAAFGAIELAVDNVDEIVEGVWAATTRELTANTNLAIPTSAQNATELLDQANGVETGLTVRQWLRLGGASLFGQAFGLDTTTAVYRDLADSKDRIVASVDVNGNRSTVIRDAS